MLAVFWPVSWAALLLIIPVEAAIGVHFSKFGQKQATKISLSANLISTLLGIPITWAGLVLVELFASHGGEASNMADLHEKVYAVTIQAPWLVPYDSYLYWMVPCAGLVLCIPFCLMSVLSEYIVARHILGSEDRSRALRWSWLANISSYMLIFLWFVGMLIYNVQTHTALK